MTDDELREVTRKTADMLFGPPKQGEGAYQLWRQFDPELARHMSLFYTGRLYAREVISQKQRELCAVAALTVLQRLEELRLHIGAALNVGATKEEVAEVIFQMMTYGGVPTTVEGLKKSARQSSKHVDSGRRPDLSAAVSGAAAGHQAASLWEVAPGITICRASRLAEEWSIARHHAMAEPMVCTETSGIGAFLVPMYVNGNLLQTPVAQCSSLCRWLMLVEE